MAIHRWIGISMLALIALGMFGASIRDAEAQGFGPIDFPSLTLN